MTEQNIFLIILFILAGLVTWVCLDIIRLLRKEEEQIFFSKDFAKTEPFLRIFEDFKKQLEQLISEDIQKNIGEFKNELQKTSEEIIKNYKSQFTSGSQEVQRVLREFSQETTKETFNLSKFALETQNKLSVETENKILELNRAAEKELSRIQEINLKVSEELSKEFTQKFGQIYQTTKEILNKKVKKTEKEIENYKKERFKEIDQKIYQLLGEVAKKIIGKTIDLSDHEKIVMEVLEKAKKEIFQS